MSKINFIGLNSANVDTNNLTDTTRIYDIQANVNLQHSQFASIDSGSVQKGGIQVATFTVWGNTFNPSFYNVEDNNDMCDILIAITNFIANVKAEIETNPITV